MDLYEQLCTINDIMHEEVYRDTGPGRGIALSGECNRDSMSDTGSHRYKICQLAIDSQWQRRMQRRIEQ